MRTRLFLAVAAFFAVSHLGAQTILTTFPADSGPGPKNNPDCAGAVGLRYAVDFPDDHFVVHDKAGGAVVKTLTQQQFWLNCAGVAPTTPNDARILFDPLTQRWFASTAGDNPEHTLYLAVSATADPTGTWHGTKMSIASPDFGFRFAVDKNGFYA
jgi:hypothetical protein